MNEELSFRLTLRLFKGEKAFGPGIAELMRNIERFGSLQKAAESMDMAYSKAWKMVRETERLLGFPLTNRVIGGENGGGSNLTPEGRLFLERYEAFAEDVKKKTEESFRKHFSDDFFTELDKVKAKGAKEVH